MTDERETRVGKRSIRLAVAWATLLALMSAGMATATPSTDARSEHQRIVEFWTHERVAQAVPRHFVLDPGRGFVPAAKPDNPGGGKPGGGGDGDGDSGLVTGASWTSGGAVVATTGKVLFQMGGSFYVCSASVVTDGSTADADSLILTAGHCAYDETNRAFATNWLFIPDYDSAPAPLTASGSFCADTEYGCWTAEALTVHTGYASAGGFNDTAVVHDFAVATVYGGGHSREAKLDGTVGTQDIAFTEIGLGNLVYAFGYPAAQKYKGNDLVYCAGPVGTDPNTGGATYRIECGMTGGSSGGPWFSPFTEGSGTGTLASVNSYGYRGDSGMYGPKFNANTQAVYTTADGATADTIVP
jgi:hypothetical protein